LLIRLAFPFESMRLILAYVSYFPLSHFLSPLTLSRIAQICAALLALGTPWIGGRLKTLFALWKEWLVRRPLPSSASASASSPSAGAAASNSASASPSVSMTATEWVDELTARAGALAALRAFVLVFADRLESQVCVAAVG
jgi:hypothetical protein